MARWQIHFRSGDFDLLYVHIVASCLDFKAKWHLQTHLEAMGKECCLPWNAYGLVQGRTSSVHGI